MEDSLPLSWNLLPVSKETFRDLRLRSGKYFVYSVDSSKTGAVELFQKLNTRYPGGFVIKGASSDWAATGADLGYKLFSSSTSADVKINFNKEIPTSISQLVARGKKRGPVEEVNKKGALRIYDELISKKPEQLKHPLRYLYQTTISEHQRCFALFNHHKRPKALLAVSKNGPYSFHTERILRSPCTRPGDLEHLIMSVIESTKISGATSFSLGEACPLDSWAQSTGTFTERILSQALLNFGFCTISHKGLFNFKNKFAPCWNKRYWISSARMSVIDWLEIAYHCNCLPVFLSKRVTPFF